MGCFPLKVFFTLSNIYAHTIREIDRAIHRTNISTENTEIKINT